MTVLLIILLLSFFSAWEELQQLIQRGDWNRKDFYSFLFWDTAWNDKWKLFDSHHIAFGLFVVTMILGFYFIRINKFWHLPLLWILFFYLRNVFMHVVLTKKKDFGYL